MKNDDANETIIGMIRNQSNTIDDIIRYVKGNCHSISLGPKTLGMLFERYADMNCDESDPSTFESKSIAVSTLKNIHPGFETSNGCQWARSDTSYLGKKYQILRKKQNGKVSEVQLIGPNNSNKKFRGVRQDIRRAISSQRCAVLDTGNNIEVDHKNGKYDDRRNASPETQNIDDFQPLSKAVNDAKRQHCRECVENGKRYDARRLGYSEGWVVGDANTADCKGCYWYDPKKIQ